MSCFCEYVLWVVFYFPNQKISRNSYVEPEKFLCIYKNFLGIFYIFPENISGENMKIFGEILQNFLEIYTEYWLSKLLNVLIIPRNCINF